MIPIPNKLHFAAFAAMIASASAIAAPLTVTNGNFQANTWNSNANTAPSSWTSSLGGTSPGNYGNASTPNTNTAPNSYGNVAHLQDRNNNYYQKNLTTDNAGLELSDYASYTVAFDFGHRNDGATTITGNINLRVAIWDLTNNVQIASQTVTTVASGQKTPAANQNLLIPTTVTLNYNKTLYTTEAVGLRFTHIGTSLGAAGSQTFNATILLDNVTVTASDPDAVFSYTAPATVQSTGAPVNFSIPFTNTGATQNLTLTAVTPGGADAAYFAVSGFTAPVTPGGSGTIDVTCTPAGAGPYTADLTVDSNDSANPSVVIPLTANVAANPKLVVTNPAAIQSAGAPVTLSIPFSNGGATLPLNISAITPGGTDAGLFVVNSFTTPVAAGGNGTISVTFTPTTGGSFSANLAVDSNDELNPSITIPLTAQVKDPGLQLSATRLDFGTLATNPGPQTATLTLTNTGAATDLNISTATLLGTPGTFSITSAPTAPIAPGGTADIVVTFTPGAATGRFGALLSITSDAPFNGSTTVPIVAQVTDGAALPTGLTVTNGNFNAGTYSSASSTAPSGWTSLPATTAGNYGQTAPGTPNLTSIAAHFQARGGNYLQQNLTTANPGLTPANTTAVTVALKQCYRNDAATAGPIMMRVALWDLAGNAEVVGRNFVMEDPGVVAGTGSNQLAAASFTMPVSSTATGDMALRISHVHPGAAATFNATAIIDDVTVSVSGSLLTPFQSWARTKGLDGTSGKENGASDDPDKDGITNHQEFAFGAEPLSASSRGLVEIVTADTTSDTQPELLITLAVRSGATFAGSPSPSASKDGVLYQILGGMGLSDWTHTVEGPLAAPVLPAGFPASAPAGYEYKTFRLGGSNGLPSHGFLRVATTPQ